MIRRACTVVALLGLFLQGSSGGHMLLVEHAKCAEHGEWVHGDQGHLDHPATDADRSLRVAPSPEGGIAHDHCLVASERRDAANPVVDAWLTAVLRIETPDRVHPADVAQGQNAPRFRVAPKTSPPA